MQTIRRLKDGTWYECRPAANGVFYIHWSEQRRSLRESTREKGVVEASAYFDEWLNHLDVAGRAASLTCAELWEAKYGMEADRAGFSWANLGPVFGSLRPAEVSQARIESYIAARKFGKIGRSRARPSTIRYEITQLYASWNAAVKSRLLLATDLPILGPPPPPSPPRERWLTDDEIARLLAAAQERDDAEASHRGFPHGGQADVGVSVAVMEPHNRGDDDPPLGRDVLRSGREPVRLSRVERFLVIALDACARRSAIQDLRWDNGQVDFEARVIHFNPPGRVQTRKRRASVPMSARLEAVLRRAYDERVSPFVLDNTSPINGALARLATNAGLEGVHPHVLRHTAATHMARRGVSLWTIAKLLGNSVEQVEKVYAKWEPDFGRDAVELIGGK